MSWKSRFRPLAWPVSGLTTAAARGLPNVPEAVRTARFPFRLLRYWFVHELVAGYAGQRRTPCSVAEVGVDEGQQLVFAKRSVEARAEEPWWFRWDAYDCRPQVELLAARGYTSVVSVDVDHPAAEVAFAHRRYDVVIACHVLEHLREPEAAVRRLARLIKPGGLLVGGGPVTPHFARGWWEKRLRRTARPFGHVSVLTPRRLDTMARAAGLERQFQSGAFLMRKTGSALEQHAWWLRFNLAFGALFPGWPGEIYFAWRCPAMQGAAVPTPQPPAVIGGGPPTPALRKRRVFDPA